MKWRALLSILLVVFIMHSTFYVFGGASKNHNFNGFENYGALAYLTPILALVNSTIYQKVVPILKSLEESMQNANYFYYFIIENVSGKNPEEIREMIKEEYESKSIKGAVLIGNVPLARYEDKAIGEVIEFPYYYMDLNGEWKDTDGDGIIDTPSGNYFPEIWVGIVRSTDEDGNNVTQIEEYIDKTIDYIDGKYYPKVQSGAFIDDDFLYLDDKIKSSLTSIYIGEEVVDQNTNSATFLKFLSNNYAYAYFIVHSDGRSYIIKTHNGHEKINPWEIKNINALFYTDFSCYGASFERGAITNHLIMVKNSNALGVLTYTAEGEPVPLLYYHGSLSNGTSFGKALVDYIRTVTANRSYFDSHIAMLIYLGFPFLKPWRPHGYREVKNLEIEGNEEFLDYAEMYGWRGSGSEKDPIKISNIMIFSPLVKWGLVLKNITLHVEISHCWILASLGVQVLYSNNVIIKDNKLYYSRIYVASSENILVENNYIEGIGYYVFNGMWNSIAISNSSFIKVYNNEIHNGTGIGVCGKRMIVGVNNGVPVFKIYYARHINVSYNKIEGLFGVGFSEVRDSYIYRNDIQFTFGGFSLSYSNHNLITENNFTLIFTKNTWTFGNTHDYYLSIFSSHDNYIYLNNFVYNGTPPKYVIFSSFIRIGSLFLSNESTKNCWNSSKYGNYWEWWANKNDTNDENDDGIVDYPYVIDANNTDYMPLKHPFVCNIKENSEFPYIYIIAIAVILIIFLFLTIYFKKRR